MPNATAGSHPEVTRVGLVLGAGGVTGDAFHRGVLRALHDNGDLARAVAASCAIPGYFHPVEINGEVYVDGGVHSPTNAGVLRGHELDLVLVSSPMSVDLSAVRPTLDVGVRAAMHRYLRREAAS